MVHHKSEKIPYAKVYVYMLRTFFFLLFSDISSYHQEYIECSPLFNTVGFICSLSFLRNAISISTCFKVLFHNDSGKWYQIEISAIVKTTKCTPRSPTSFHQAIFSSLPKRSIKHADTRISSTYI